MPPLPLRRYLFLLVIAGVLPLAVLSGVGLLALFEQARRNELRHAQEITRALATAVDAELNRSIAALRILAPSRIPDGSELAGFHERMVRARDLQPEWLSLNLADAAGTRLLDTNVPPGQSPGPVLERPSFETVVRSGQPAIGTLALGARRHAFAVRLPLAEEGRVRMVLTAAVDPGSILRIVQRQAVPDDWVISVFEARGMRVARSRAHEQSLGTPAAQSLLELMSGGTSEGTGLTRVLEGDSVFTAFTRLPNGWAVATGIPESVVNRLAARSIALYALAVLLSIAAGAAAAAWLARRASQAMDELHGAAQAVGRGEAPRAPATRIAEVNEVGAALVAAARERRAHEQEREDLLGREQAARNEAENANRAKDQFLAMLAHELRNPLAAISNASALLDDERCPPEAATRARSVIRRQVRHLARLTDDLLDAARALLGKIQIDPKAQDLSAIVAQSLRTVAASGRAASHQVVERLEEAWVSGDAVRLEQIVANLLENAIKYTPAGGRITVATAREGAESVVRVSDTGAGIPPELAVRVFDLFVQGARGIDRSPGGLGIGLTLVKRLAELHGGRVEVRSEGEGRGSEFSVRLPAIAPPAAEEPRPGLPKPIGLSILVVEDNDDARETMRALLEMMGQRVETASDGISGLDKALAMAPDVGLIDIGLPGIDGFELARRLRAAGDRGTFLVAVTGYGAEDDRARALRSGFDAHVTKPAEIPALMALMASATARARATSNTAAGCTNSPPR